MPKPTSITGRVNEILVLEVERLYKKASHTKAGVEVDDTGRCPACRQDCTEGLSAGDGLLLERLVALNRKIRGLDGEKKTDEQEVDEDELLADLKKQQPELYPPKGPRGPRDG